MDNIPLELLRKILLEVKWDLLSHLHEPGPKTSWVPYATVSRKWQSIVESFTFNSLELTQMRLDVAEAYNYLTPPRLAHLRHVRFEIRFPAHDLHVSTNPEDYDDQVVFDKAIRQILGLLARVPRRRTPLIHLTLLIWPSREHCIPWVGYVPREKDKVFSGKLRRTYLELPADWDRNIQDLSEISFFRVELQSLALVFAPASINLIAKSFSLEYVRKPPKDKTFQPQGIVPPDATSDLLSRELHHFSQRDGLREFLLDASVDSTILWPEFQDPESKPPTWPNMSMFHIELNDVLPSGQWIQIRDPEAEEDRFSGNWDWDDGPTSEVPGDEYEKRFDCTYNPILFERFALAAARAASQMPKIEEFYLTNHGFADMGVSFVTRGFTKSFCLEFTGDPPPTPSEETLDAWRNAVNLHGMEWNVRFAYGANSYYFYHL
ncbi:hypothetical protein MRS44_006987 [Fusarium solani]|uniref:uncharacterized protein n=1 Tax=Fusarium solani TaxID=169388 RepID=UPI0032C3F029|nr:hypothetical protein MRS44_006987 [Fusarium solani]